MLWCRWAILCTDFLVFEYLCRVFVTGFLSICCVGLGTGWYLDMLGVELG